MTSKFLRCLTFILCVLVVGPISAIEKSVKIAVLTTGPQQMAAYNKLFSQFESSTNINVELQFFSDITFKKHIKDWIELGTYDLLYWQAGKRLEDLVTSEEIIPLSNLMKLGNLKPQYTPNVLPVVTYDDEIYALPLGHYIWGFYYNKSIFNELKLSPPKTWKAFKKLMITLKEKGVTPLVQATDDQWPILAWLDYLSVHIGGEKFRSSLVNGDSVSPAYMADLLKEITYLTNKDVFFAPEHTWRWDQVIPAVLRQQAAMTLMGQFVEEKIELIGNEKIGFFPFPEMGLGHDDIEVAPMEVLVVPSSSNKQTQVASLLNFISNYTAIDSLAFQLGWLSVSKQPAYVEALSERSITAQKRVQNASSLVQFFDRDASTEVSLAWGSALISSIRSGNTKAIERLNNEGIQTNTSITENMIDEGKLLSFSSMTGKGTYLYSRVLSEAYGTLGYDVSVNRYKDSKAVISSFSFGADGDLVRVIDIPELNKVAIKVPESILETRLFLVGGPNVKCDLKNNLLPMGSSLAYGIDAKIFEEWVTKLHPDQVLKKSYPAAWRSLYAGGVDYMLVFEPELFTKRKQLEGLCYRTLQKVASYHHLANKHADIVNKVSDAIKSIKQTEKYQSIKMEFGLGLLPDAR
jgi:ABC-type glycerol-3-phosphate transport system substrate-binding protein